MNPPAKYPVVLTNVLEITLHAAADLAYWRAQMQPLNLYPFNFKGAALFFITASKAKFNGIPFREFSVSLATSKHADGSSHDGFFLNHAFNALRLFAFVERRIYRTPYYHGRVEVKTEPAASIHLRVQNQLAFSAAKSTATRVQSAPEWWEGPIVLPDLKTPAAMPHNYFFAKIGGDTEIYPFSARDLYSIHLAPTAPVFQQLLESHLQPQEWHIRRRAVHSKSNTSFTAESPFGY